MAKKKSKAKKIIIALIVILLIAAIATGAYFFIKKRKAKNNVASSILRVKKEVIENVIEVSGNIEAAEIQTLQAQGDGTVKKVFVKEGAFIKKGQVILQLDSDEEDYNISKHDYDYKTASITKSGAELAILRQQREMLLKKLEKRQVIARIDGVLASLDKSVEDYCEAKDTVGTIVDRTYLKAAVEVVETDAPRLAVGQKVELTFPAYEKTLTAEIISYPSIGRITSRGATVVDAEIRLDNPPDEILPGYSFTGKIEITAPETVYIIERYAIIREQGKAFAEKMNRDGTTERVEVKVEPYDTDYVKILSGLNEGDMVKSQQRDKSGSAANKGGAFGMPGAPGGNNRGGGGGGMPGGGMVPMR